LIKLNLF